MKQSIRSRGRSWRWLAAAAVAVVVAVCGDSRPAFAMPSIGANANVNLNGNVNTNNKIALDITGLQQIVQMIDADTAALAKTTQTQARDDIIAILKQVSTAISAQISQIQSASVEVVNSVADRVDAQLKTLLAEVQSLEKATANLVLTVEDRIAKHLEKQIQQIEQDALVVIQQLQADIVNLASRVAKFIDQEIDRLYTRTGDAADLVAARLAVFNERVVLLATHAVLGGLLLWLLFRVAHQARSFVRERHEERERHEGRERGHGFPVELVASVMALIGVGVLLTSNSLEVLALGLPPAEKHVDACARADVDYLKFVADDRSATSGGATPDETTTHRLEFEGVTVQEELQRCVYLSVSEDRAEGAQMLMNDVRIALRGLSKNTAVASARTK